MALCLWTVARGARPVFQADELYFWLNTYAAGPVRRGLAGTLLSPALGDAAPGAVHEAAALCTLLAVGLLVTWMAVAWYRREGQAAALALAASSPFLGLLAHGVGYPDGLVAATVLTGAWLMMRTGAPGLACVLVLAGLLHELALLLLLPMAVLRALLAGWGVRKFAVLAVGAGCACLLATRPGQDDAALIARLVRAGLTPGEAADQVAISLHQHAVPALRLMLRSWRAHAVNGLAGVAYAGLPGVLIAALGLRAARDASAGGGVRRLMLPAYLASCLGGLLLLALAWDLSRLASFTTLTALVTTMLLVPRAPPSRARAGAVWAAACSFACMPVCNLYFDYGQPLNLRLMRSVCPVCAIAGQAAMDFYNRDLSEGERGRIDGDPAYGNAVGCIKAAGSASARSCAQAD